MGGIRHLGDKAIDEADLVLVEKQSGRFQGVNSKLGEVLTVHHPSEVAWDDLRFPGSSVKLGATSPTWVDIGAPYAGLYALEFAHTANQEVHMDVQMPHDWLEGSTIYPHVHWINHEVYGAGGDIQWTLDYSFAQPHEAFDTLVSIDVVDAVPETQFTHELVKLPAIVMTGYTLSCMGIMKLYREADATGDDYDDGIGLLEFDIHYQRDSMGSRTELVK